MTENELKSQLEAACTDLWWSSENDYPVEVVWQTQAQPDSRQNIRQWVEDHCGNNGPENNGPGNNGPESNGSENNTPITTLTTADFFVRQLTPKSWHTHEDKAQQSRLHQLKTLLEACLSNLQVYRCGEIEVKVYILGLTPEGCLAGVRTVLIET